MWVGVGGCGCVGVGVGAWVGGCGWVWVCGCGWVGVGVDGGSMLCGDGEQDEHTYVPTPKNACCFPHEGTRWLFCTDDNYRLTV